MSHQIVEIDREMNSMMTNGTIFPRTTTNQISSLNDNYNDEELHSVSLHMNALPTSEPTERNLVPSLPIRSKDAMGAMRLQDQGSRGHAMHIRLVKGSHKSFLDSMFLKAHMDELHVKD